VSTTQGGLLSVRRRPVVLALFLLVQMLAAVFFVGDAVADILEDDVGPHLYFELLVALALALGVALGAIVLRLTLGSVAHDGI
jgi:hypothetical protein